MVGYRDEERGLPLSLNEREFLENISKHIMSVNLKKSNVLGSSRSMEF